MPKIPWVERKHEKYKGQGLRRHLYLQLATDDDNENKLVISNGLYFVLTTKSVCVSSILN